MMAGSGVAILSVSVLLCVLAKCSCNGGQNVFDLWDSVVSEHIHVGELEGVSLHVVDYAAISKDGNYTAFIDAIGIVDISTFDNVTVYAFFMNVYNALAIKMIIDHPCSSACHPIKGIKDIGSLLHPVWNMPAGEVGGKQWTLNEVEGYLRDPKPFKEDSRLHACIVCASISCPDVRMEAFRPEKISQQMTDQVTKFLANPKKGSLLDKDSNTLHLSPIFLWFFKDFEPYGGVPSFVSTFLPSDEVKFISQMKPAIKYFSYDWNVNGVPPCKC